MRRDAAGRLAGEQDAHGTALSALEWRSDGRLQHARVRLPDGSWIAIEPGAGAPGPWDPALFYDEERLRQKKEFEDLANLVMRFDPVAGAKVKDATRDTFMRWQDFGWQGGR